MPAIAFFPWLRIVKPVSFGELRLVPYDSAATWSADLVRILGAYKHGVRQPVEHATLVEVRGSVEPDIGDSELEQIAQLREALCFAGLHKRQLFHYQGYVNAHSFQCIVQNFQPGKLGVGVTARRRDGGASSLWFDEREVQCPAHVSPQSPLVVDEAIASALLRRSGATDGDWLRDGIELFNLANTDSSDVRAHTELLLIVAAAQRLMGVEKKSDAHELSARFVELLDVAAPATKPESSEGLATGAKPPRRAWFEDFYASRGVIAHGRPSGKPRATWSIIEHLLLASYIVPRLTLVRLQQLGDYELTQNDRDEVAAFDYLLAEPKLFEAQEEPSGAQLWPWREALSKAHDAVWHDRAVLALTAVLEADSDTEND